MNTIALKCLRFKAIVFKTELMLSMEGQDANIVKHYYPTRYLPLLGTPRKHNRMRSNNRDVE